MRAVIQRVTKASVSVDGEVVGSIGEGICVLIGIKRDDTPEDMNFIIRKILNTKIFDGENGKRWSLNVMEKGFEILCISQFTLYHVLKGTKPDFHRAMPSVDSEKFYNNFLSELKSKYKPELIQNGKFGARMKVELLNDGPVTLEVESPVKNIEQNTSSKASVG